MPDDTKMRHTKPPLFRLIVCPLVGTKRYYIVNCTIRNKRHWKMNQAIGIFTEETAFENVNYFCSFHNTCSCLITTQKLHMTVPLWGQSIGNRCIPVYCPWKGPVTRKTLTWWDIIMVFAIRPSSNRLHVLIFRCTVHTQTIRYQMSSTPGLDKSYRAYETGRIIWYLGLYPLSGRTAYRKISPQRDWVL